MVEPLPAHGLSSPMVIADRLAIPDNTVAILFDLDGVLIDSLHADYEIIQRLLLPWEHLDVQVDRAFIRAHFAYALPDFWERLLSVLNLPYNPNLIDRLVIQHEEERRRYPFALHEGIPELLADARERSIRTAVVSNNPAIAVHHLIQAVGLAGQFDVVVGNDQLGLRKKPFPDCYLHAASILGLPTARCVAVEDSLLGAEAASSAGCYTVAVATGANDFRQLASSQYVDVCYMSFALPGVALGSDPITSKSLVTPNEFVSHMIEHVAWRMGRSVNVLWTSDDWRGLGMALGRAIGASRRIAESAAALGMIDDGSCEVALTACDAPVLELKTSQHVDRDWFVNLRCEQLTDGRPLMELLEGLVSATCLATSITVMSVEDAHHAWEGVFRAVGIALERMYGCTQQVSANDQPTGDALTVSLPSQSQSTAGIESSVRRGWHIDHADTVTSSVRRETAESTVRVQVSMGNGDVACNLAVSDSIHMSGLRDALEWFADGAGLDLDVEFTAIRLSSSHVVMEDIGLAVGRALSYLASVRMDQLGIYGAGSNVRHVRDLAQQRVRAAISIEGRKFWRFVPLTQNYDEFRRGFLIGHTLRNGLYTEDLDDFIDGFAGGLAASIVIHMTTQAAPQSDWQLVYSALGHAVAEALSENRTRRGLIAGVKATLA